MKKWHWVLCFVVFTLTIYNVLPTLCYYKSPLDRPLQEKEGREIGEKIGQRMKDSAKDSLESLLAFCEEIGASPKEVSTTSSTISLSFATEKEANHCKQFLAKAGPSLPFAPSHLFVSAVQNDPLQVRVVKKTRSSLIPLYSFAEKGSPAFLSWVSDRKEHLLDLLHRPSPFSMLLDKWEEGEERALFPVGEFLEMLSEIAKKDEPLAKRIASWALAHRKTFPPTLLSQLHNTPFSNGANLCLRWGMLDMQEEGHPFFTTVLEEKDHLRLVLRKDLPSLDPCLQLLAQEVASLAALSHETILEDFSIPILENSNASSLLLFDMKTTAEKGIEELLSQFATSWQKEHPDLSLFSFVDAPRFEALSFSQKPFALLLSSPWTDSFAAFRPPALFASCQGLDALLATYEDAPHSPLAKTLEKDIHNLFLLLQEEGFVPSSTSPGTWENPSFLSSLFAPTREKIFHKGTGRFAALELSTRGERIRIDNRIDTEIHEDLLKHQDEYRLSQISSHRRYTVLPPTKNLVWSNCKLYWKKIWRGDPTKTLRWGLDLSGGKTVQIELLDQRGEVVRDDALVLQGMEEIRQRINKRGLQEIAIRKLGHQISIDFPSAQTDSAQDLLHSSSMSFHIVNETLSLHNKDLAPVVNRFLEEVWHQALLAGTTDPTSLHSLGEKLLSSSSPTKAAKILQEKGLRLASPKTAPQGNPLDEAPFSTIVRFRGDSSAAWQGQSHPLLLVLTTPALEGAHLEHIRSGYDPARGNYLSFDVQAKGVDSLGNVVFPQKNLYEWTSRFAASHIASTPHAHVTEGRGWRMAASIDGYIVSAPSLESAISDSAMVTGSFSTRELQRLVQDLQGGTIRFTPRILAEHNVSPELGLADRAQGILSMGVALLLVVASMVWYYRFAGWVASVAVLFNLLILWAVLQNLQATLSLAGIAGIILTVGMAVDANVLVFERIKEELQGGATTLFSAIQKGYQKAFSAILDSNLTTLLAGAILLSFDAGPVQSFAINLLIGISSSMFTALFATRLYFTYWLQNPRHTSLSFSSALPACRYDFLRTKNIAFSTIIALFLVGSSALWVQREKIWGIDFTGGVSLTLQFEETSLGSYKERALSLLSPLGVSPKDLQIQELSTPSHLRFLFAKSLFEKDPLPEPFLKNCTEAFSQGGLFPTQHSLENLSSSWTLVSGQISNSLQSQALLSLALAFGAIFLYLAFRFEKLFALAALLAILHDVLLTIACAGILSFFGVPLQIDLTTIAALLTILGYCLNDKIIVFDRIREERKLDPHLPWNRLILSSIHATWSRTCITSGTTLLVLLSLLFLGGSSIFGFSLFLTLGVILGTLSSWFVAPQLLSLFVAKKRTSPLSNTPTIP